LNELLSDLFLIERRQYKWRSLFLKRNIGEKW
jgi:hypothetical protein